MSDIKVGMLLNDIANQMIGRQVKLPDGGNAHIEAVSVSGQFHRIEYCIAYWYQGSRYAIWLEPNEVTLIPEEVSINDN